jgi:hypothetical protein
MGTGKVMHTAMGVMYWESTSTCMRTALTRMHRVQGIDCGQAQGRPYYNAFEIEACVRACAEADKA